MKNCNGYNCKSNKEAHSNECILEHNHAVIGFVGNEYPEARYKGYTGEKLDDKASDNEKSAWWEGFIAQTQVNE